MDNHITTKFSTFVPNACVSMCTNFGRKQSTLEPCDGRAAPPPTICGRRRRRLLLIGAPPPPIICRRAADTIVAAQLFFGICDDFFFKVSALWQVQTSNGFMFLDVELLL